MAMKPWRRLLVYLRPYWLLFVLVLFLTLAVTLTTLALPWIIGKNLIDSVILGEKNLKLLNLIVLGIIGIVALKGLFSFAQTYLISLISFRAVTELRNRVYEQLQRLSLSIKSLKTAFYNILSLCSDALISLNTLLPYSSSNKHHNYSNHNSAILEPYIECNRLSFIEKIVHRIEIDKRIWDYERKYRLDEIVVYG